MNYYCKQRWTYLHVRRVTDTRYRSREKFSIHMYLIRHPNTQSWTGGTGDHIRSLVLLFCWMTKVQLQLQQCPYISFAFIWTTYQPRFLPFSDFFPNSFCPNHIFSFDLPLIKKSLDHISFFFSLVFAPHLLLLLFERLFKKM